MLLSYNNCCYLLQWYVCVPQQAASCLNVLLPAPFLCRTPAFLSVPEQQITLGVIQNHHMWEHNWEAGRGSGSLVMSVCVCVFGGRRGGDLGGRGGARAL
jgi:hypothetical protein